MFDELTALLDDNRNRSSNESILVTSLDFDSNLLLQHFVSCSLKNISNCVYISLMTPFAHLKHVQGKMGNVLKTSPSCLTFIPLYSSLSEHVLTGKSPLTVDDLCAIIKQQVVSSANMVIVEDLQILRHVLKFSEAQVLLFVRQLRNMFEAAQFITQVSILDEDDHVSSSSPFINMLKRMHEKHIFVRNLATGATKDITGQLIYTGPSPSGLWTSDIIRKCLFRVNDRTLSLITSAV